ncbi:MAG: trypsin-like peptidase domain-containing protein [Moraxella sp.]|nr:trypsin-like peptidase domain-containing protein [Moraxella sp.]
MKQSPLNHQQGMSAWTILPWLLFVTLAVIFWWFATSQKPTPSSSLAEEPQAIATVAEPVIADSKPVSSYHDAVAKASVSVVNIYTAQRAAQHPYANDPMFREFLQQYGFNAPQSQDNTSLGSGVVVSADGYIVTNAHVINGADEITVMLSDGQKGRATVIGTDTESDLAVIKVEMTGLTPLAFRSSPIRVGDVTLAIGNPFGVGQTVTQGIVSATGRTGLGVSTFEDFIQTDAAINPGNSGGALTDANGDLIGINTVIYSRSGGSMGIGFAIPTSIVEKVMNDLINTGVVSRGWLGIEMANTVNDPTNLEIADGVLIAGVQPNGPAANAGMRTGDIITAINGTKINTPSALVQYISAQSPNSVLSVDIQRGENTQSINVTLAQRPNMNGAASINQNE